MVEGPPGEICFGLRLDETPEAYGGRKAPRGFVRAAILSRQPPLGIEFLAAS